MCKYTQAGTHAGWPPPLHSGTHTRTAARGQAFMNAQPAYSTPLTHDGGATGQGDARARSGHRVHDLSDGVHARRADEGVASHRGDAHPAVVGHGHRLPPERAKGNFHLPQARKTPRGPHVRRVAVGLVPRRVGLACRGMYGWARAQAAGTSAVWAWCYGLCLHGWLGASRGSIASSPPCRAVHAAWPDCLT